MNCHICGWNIKNTPNTFGFFCERCYKDLGFQKQNIQQLYEQQTKKLYVKKIDVSEAKVIVTDSIKSEPVKKEFKDEFEYKMEWMKL